MVLRTNIFGYEYFYFKFLYRSTSKTNSYIFKIEYKKKINKTG